MSPGRGSLLFIRALSAHTPSTRRRTSSWWPPRRSHPSYPTPTQRDTCGLPSGQLTHAPCWVAPEGSFPSPWGVEEVGRERRESTCRGPRCGACGPPWSKPALNSLPEPTERERQTRTALEFQLPSFQPIAGVLEGPEPTLTVVNLRHLTITKLLFSIRNLLNIWECGLTKSYFKDVTYIFLFLHLLVYPLYFHLFI